MPGAQFTRTEGAGGFAAPPAPGPVQPSAPQPQQAAPQTQPAPVREAPSASLDVVLPDGRVVVLERPGVACQFMVYRILGGVCPDGSVPSGLNVTVKALMYIKSLDGRVITRPYDHVQAQVLMNDLGDDGTEIVAGAYLQHFLLQKTNLPLSGR